MSGFTIGEPFNPYRRFTGIFIPEAVCKDLELSLGAKVIYGRLCRYAGEDGKAYPSVPTLGHQIGLSGKQARRYIRELEKRELIRAERVNGKQSNYVFLWHAIFENCARKAPFPETGNPINWSGAPPIDGTPENGSQRESVPSREPANERTTKDTDCPPKNRKKRDSSPDGMAACPSKCKQYPNLRELMAKYMSDDPSRMPEDYPSDRMVVETVNAATLGAGYTVPETDVLKCLQYLYNERRLQPGTKAGPRHFSWFPTVVQDYFARKRAREEVANPIGHHEWQERNESREEREERERRHVAFDTLDEQAGNAIQDRR